MAGADTIERLRQYLREVPPPARSLLIGELEHSLLRGDAGAGADLVLHELRRVLREQREGVPRISNAARRFFEPLEPFLVDDSGDHARPGRIMRSALEKLWTWIRRDLLPEEARNLADGVSAALLAGGEPKARHVIRAFQDRVLAVLETSFESAATDKTIHQRMLAQIGTRHPSEDATTLKSVLKGRDALADLAAHLPLRIGNLSGSLLDECKVLIENVSARDGDMFLYALLTVKSRLAAPWQLIRLGIRAAGVHTAARVAKTHYSVAVTIVLDDLERMMGDLRNDLHGGGGVAVGASLKLIHDTMRGLRTELELPVDSTWGRALAALRIQVADLLCGEIESIAGRVQRLLRPRSSIEIRPYSALDRGEVAETEALVAFVGACRRFAGELAINDMTQRAFAALQQYLDTGTPTLLGGLHHAGTADRSFRQYMPEKAHVWGLRHIP